MVVKAKYAENMCRCANFKCADVQIVTLRYAIVYALFG